MEKTTDIIALRQPESVDDPLTEIARDGARRMLAAALTAIRQELFCVLRNCAHRGSADKDSNLTRTAVPI